MTSPPLKLIAVAHDAPLPPDMAALLEHKAIDWQPVLAPFVEELLTVQPTTVEQITEHYRKPKRRP